MTFTRTSLTLSVAIALAACGTTGTANAAPETEANSTTASAPLATNYADRIEVQKFVEQLNAKYDYPKAELLKAFAQAERMDTVLRQLERDKPDPNFKKNWTTYRSRYIEPLRIKAGVEFWKKNAATLSRATREYGVPEYIIAGIIGAETIYGRYMGDHSVFDVLTTLAFDYPRRSAEYKEFLEEYIILTRENKMPLRSVKGSYAGAIGIPQFMPDSWRDYGVDFDNDGKVDLRNSTADAIGSVANFLKTKGGWQKGLDVIYAVQFDSKPKVADALKLPIEPSKTIDELKAYGISSPESIPANVKLALIDLPNGDNPAQYVLGSKNFYAITRYNKSYMYAMSVYELGAAVKKSYDAGGASTAPAKPVNKPASNVAPAKTTSASAGAAKTTVQKPVAKTAEKTTGKTTNKASTGATSATNTSTKSATTPKTTVKPSTAGSTAAKGVDPKKTKSIVNP